MFLELAFAFNFNVGVIARLTFQCYFKTHIYVEIETFFDFDLKV